MHDLNLRLFYKTSFDIRPADDAGDALWSVVMDLRGWIVAKWDRKGVAIPADVRHWSKFKLGGEIRSEDPGSTVKLTSRACFGDRGILWACTVTERERPEGYAEREWVTEVGFAPDGAGGGTVSLVTSYGDAPGFWGPCAPAPVATVPGLVSRIVDDAHLTATVDGRTPRLGTSETLTPDNATGLASLVLDAGRVAPVVLVAAAATPGDPAYPVDPDAVAATLGPSAHVIRAQDPAALAAFNGACPEGYGCEAGWVRAYAPKPDTGNADDVSRHRYYDAERANGLGAGEVLAILRRVLGADVSFYETMTREADVARAVGISKRRKRLADMHALHEREQNEALELAEEIAQELDLAQERLDDAKARLKDLQDENFNLTSRLDWVIPRLSANAPVADIDLPSWPPSPTDIARLFSAAYPDKLDFTERGWDTLADCRTSPDVLWNALHDLVAVAHPLHAGDEGCDVARAFNDRSTFEYARGAGMMTRKNHDLIAAYQDVYQGRDLDCQHHLKSGVKESDPRFLRLYFAYDAPSGRLVVSHVGRHLDTYGTRKMK